MSACNVFSSRSWFLLEDEGLSKSWMHGTASDGAIGPHSCPLFPSLHLFPQAGTVSLPRGTPQPGVSPRHPLFTDMAALATSHSCSEHYTPCLCQGLPAPCLRLTALQCPSRCCSGKRSFDHTHNNLSTKASMLIAFDNECIKQDSSCLGLL